MIKIKNILVPTDFSNLSLTVSELAVNLAEQYSAKIHLLHVLEKTPPILTIRSLDLSEEKIIKTLEQDAHSKLENAVKKFKKNSNVEIEPVIRKGIDFDQIIKYAEKAKIDLIIIATHGRTGFMHTLLGSVAEKVIRFSKTPVLVSKPDQAVK
ncbi:MAG: universal stress protein [Ignavibacteriales bacterium]|nr:MAG: universal stress protein [Ignavibacteriales bacterium]